MPSWVIVGASRGLGYQFLKTLSQDPANTVIGIVRDVLPTEAKISADALPNIHIISGDLTDPSSLNSAAKDVSRLTSGKLDHLIINGAYLSTSTAFLGVQDYLSQETLFLDEVNASMRTNVVGALYAINAFIPLLQKSAIKKVVVISTGIADPETFEKGDLKENIPYTISKGAVNILTAKYAAQYRGEGIKFLALSPGFVLTVEDPENIPSEVVVAYERLGRSMRKLDPNWKAPLTPKESVEMQLNVIDGLTLEQSGAFLSHRGNKEWL